MVLMSLMPLCPVSRIGHSIDYYTILSRDEDLDYIDSSSVSSNDSEYLNNLNDVDCPQLKSVVRGTWERDYGDKISKKWPSLFNEHLKLDYSRHRLNSPYVNGCVPLLSFKDGYFDPMAKYSKIECIVMFGGIINDTYLLPANPENQTLHASVDSFLKTSDWEASDELFICSFNNFVQRWQLVETDHGLGPRAFHSTAVIFALQGIPLIFLFGGLTAKDKLADNELYYMQLYDNTSSFGRWSRLDLAEPKPAPRYGHTLRQVGYNLVLYGGIVNNEVTNEVWVLNLQTLTTKNSRWEKVFFPGLVPPPTTFHAAVSVGKNKYAMLIYGGITKNLTKARIYALCLTDCGNWIWKSFPVILKVPDDIRAFHTMHVIDRNVIIVGGENYLRNRSVSLNIIVYCMRTKTFFYRNQIVPMAGHASWVTKSLLHFFGGLAEPDILPPGIVTCNPLGFTTNPIALFHYYQLVGNDEPEDSDIDEGVLGIEAIGSSNDSMPLTSMVVLDTPYTDPGITFKARPQRSSAFKALQNIKRDMEAHKMAEDNNDRASQSLF